jgi:diguanylate cyclase (GGDEF)-like protein
MMNALVMSMEISGICIAIASLFPLFKITEIAHANRLTWAWRALTGLILCCVLAATTGVVINLRGPARVPDIAGTIPRFLGPCFVFAVAWLSFKTAKELQRFAGLKEIAFKDHLTGIANRRALHDRLSDELQQVGTVDSSLYVILLDIDHFKKINDQYGHGLGDVVLKRVAELLRDNVDAGDLAGRFGGEEFLVIMSRTSQSVALTAANRLRNLISESRTLLDIGSDILVTVSCGITALRADDSVATLLRRADLALYASKREGRNRVTLSS